MVKRKSLLGVFSSPQAFPPSSLVPTLLTTYCLVVFLQVEKELGERRLVGFTGVGLAVASELNFDSRTAATTSKEEVSLRIPNGLTKFLVSAECHLRNPGFCYWRIDLQLD